MNDHPSKYMYAPFGPSVMRTIFGPSLYVCLLKESFKVFVFCIQNELRFLDIDNKDVCSAGTSSANFSVPSFI